MFTHFDRMTRQDAINWNCLPEWEDYKRREWARKTKKVDMTDVLCATGSAAGEVAVFTAGVTCLAVYLFGLVALTTIPVAGVMYITGRFDKTD